MKKMTIDIVQEAMVTIPRRLLEELLDAAKEYRAENDWKRGTTLKNNNEMKMLDYAIAVTEDYLEDEAENN